TMGLTGKAVPYKAGFGPMPAGIYHVPFPLEQYGVTIDDSLKALELLFKVDIPASQVAAIIIEPVQGEGGFQIAPKAFLQALRRLCDEHGIVLICDEIQTGFGRTGKIFATEYADIEPDLLVVAKSLAGGYPLAAVIGKAEVMDSPEPGGLGTTYGGNPVSCAAANAVLDIIEEEQLCERSNRIGEQMKARLTEIKAARNTTPIGEIRGLGAMVAFDLVKTAGENDPDPDKAKKLTSKALENGLILLSCGVYGNTIRLLAPLTIPEEQLEEGLNILEQSLAEC
ncbi:MAG: aminotransferase class III-fold pyridoxal phosphate-dependent enzyme, partial [Deltaproteobacteria bacterium]|nr:aminotransferase class III-fold pyridoxal phosphate-dependent enzyme [Deltaproteobacteria bacterium]